MPEEQYVLLGQAVLLVSRDVPSSDVEVEVDDK
jgi:hypothetical protein